MAKNVYRAYVNIYSDGDFYYENSSPFRNPYTSEVEYYANSREYAAEVIKDVYDELVKTIESSILEVEGPIDTIKSFQSYLHILLQHLDTFIVDMDMGNQNIQISLSRHNIDETSTGFTMFENHEYLVPFSFCIYTKDSIDRYDWDLIKEMEVMNSVKEVR